MEAQNSALEQALIDTGVLVPESQVAGKYEITDAEYEEVRKRFTYHPPKDDQPARYVAIREIAFHFALGLYQNVPRGRELARALTHLEDVVFCANAGIARNE